MFKRWSATFICLNSRAVHLGVATSLETDCFINIFRRFINRRGLPKCIYSDNGSNFVGAEREITTAIEDWNQKQIHDELLQKGCQWVFHHLGLHKPVGSGKDNLVLSTELIM